MGMEEGKGDRSLFKTVLTTSLWHRPIILDTRVGTVVA